MLLHSLLSCGIIQLLSMHRQQHDEGCLMKHYSFSCAKGTQLTGRNSSLPLKKKEFITVVLYFKYDELCWKPFQVNWLLLSSQPCTVVQYSLRRYSVPPRPRRYILHTTDEHRTT